MSLPPLPAGTRRALVAYLDTRFGSLVASQLVAQGVEVAGLVTNALNVNSELVKSSGAKKILKRNDAEGVRRALLDAEYVVFQLVDGAQDALAAIKLLHTNHFDVEKRFVLVSSLMTWHETAPLIEPAAPEDGAAADEAPELEPLTEDQYNRRVPHMKYLAWREAEKVVAAAHSDRLKTFVVFAGLPYGKGEELLHPLFKQAWSLAAEGLPIFGSGRQSVPMIHVQDLAKFAQRLLSVEEIPELRYLFATDDGAASWNDIVKAVNNSLGNGKSYRVPSHEWCIHDSVEHFTVNLKVDPQQMQGILSEEDWVAKSGFVENIELVVSQYREARGIIPLRVVVLGPPQAGKTHVARELGELYRMPVFDIADMITEYKYQEKELQELVRIRHAKAEAKIQEKLDEKRQVLLEERKAAREAELAERAEGELLPDEDNDDVEEEEELDVHLPSDEEKEIRDAVAEDNDDERITAINEKLEELKKVLALRVKPQVDASLEPPNPKDKKKPAPPPKKDAKKGQVEEVEEVPKDSLRFTDRALAIMARWKLTRMQCKNQGYVMSGFPKNMRQAKLLFDDPAIEVPEDADEPEAAAPTSAVADEGERVPQSDAVYPSHVIQLRASDAYLLDRLQRTQREHVHNNPEDFQRRLDAFKTHFEGAVSVYSYFESGRTVGGKSALTKSFDVEGCPFVLPPAPKSQYAPKTLDPLVNKIRSELIGNAHNFGPTPQDVHRELVRQRKLEEEQRVEAETQLRKRKEKEAQEVSQAQKALEEAKYNTNKIRESERQMLEARKAPLKAYLMQQVIPVLTKGLIEVCNRKPEDPVDFLAEWLFRHNPEDDDDVYQ
ncbi:Hypothetical protein, putative [Bodo saltans]|uniref:Adenylate kinase n=2 Tax=Bodo saltans TaxID=75058 RepID=A0A0S4JBN3_BODSA|nr:Hypothetical protein, putative [Bodo saltans]|eukprot:CUG87619.1 Hypothetical protein, putative [Bodo saltans]